MGSRLALHAILVGVLGSSHVYFQPPETVKLVYPAILYERTADNTTFADNRSYIRKRKYTATIIDRDPDTLIPDRLGESLPCELSQVYQADNLNHYVFNLHY